MRILTSVNAGLGAARNLGIPQSTGRYVLALDADNVLAPDFVERAVEILEEQVRRPPTYVVVAVRRRVGTPFAGWDLGYEPLGNFAALNAKRNVAGDAMALMRRSLFDAGYGYSEELTSFEDWLLYRRLQRVRSPRRRHP